MPVSPVISRLLQVRSGRFADGPAGRRRCLSRTVGFGKAGRFAPWSTTNSLTETVPDIDVEARLKSAFERGWGVIVWNEPFNLMEYVVHVFKEVLKMNDGDARRHMLEVHEQGKSLVARATREKAEFIVHRLQGFGLNTTLEHL